MIIINAYALTFAFAQHQATTAKSKESASQHIKTQQQWTKNTLTEKEGQPVTRGLQ